MLITTTTKRRSRNLGILFNRRFLLTNLYYISIFQFLLLDFFFEIFTSLFTLYFFIK